MRVFLPCPIHGIVLICVSFRLPVAKAFLAGLLAEPFTTYRHEAVFAHYAWRFGPAAAVHKRPDTCDGTGASRGHSAGGGVTVTMMFS